MSNATTKDFDDNDEYIAKLLAEDARQSSIKYASQGMSALLPKKISGGSGLKPNTRFLKTLVREADSHNAALKKKEEVEARARLRAIKDDRRRSEAERRTRRHHRDRDDRHRHREPERKKRRLSYSDHDEDEEKRTRHSRDSRHTSDSRSSRKDRRSRSPGGEPSRTRESRRRMRRDDDDDEEGSESRRRSRHRRRQDDHKSRRLSRSRSRSLDRSQDEKADAVNESSHKTHRHHKRRSNSSTSSDPLRSIVGPGPLDHFSTTTTTKRGRGFTSGGQSSNIDAHFDSNYNPSLDVGADLLESDDDEAADWDNALEALRDRRAWREKQVDRLREAGFDDDQIKRWESSTASKSRLDGGGGGGDHQNVRWSKKGEQREWDVGKKPAFHQSDGDDVDTTSSKATERIQGKKRGKGEKAVGEAWRGKGNGLLKQFRSALG